MMKRKPQNTIAVINAKKSKTPTGFARGLKPDRILGVISNTEGLFHVIKWRGTKEIDIVPATETNMQYPDLVISFYENRICWI